MEQKEVVVMGKPEGIPVVIEGVVGRVTSVRAGYDHIGILHKHHSLDVWVEFDPSFEGTLGVGLIIPPKRYERKEFVLVVERALVKWLKTERQLKLYRQEAEREEEELKALAKRVSIDLGLGSV